LVLRLSLEIELRQALEGIRVRPLVKREESFPKLGTVIAAISPKGARPNLAKYGQAV
jgi:hypothetical protein